ncbi:MAG: hypothetical protein AAF519_17520 [Bacteroidota bacterium]
MTKQADNEIKKTLESLDKIKAVAPDAFFYTRLKARMEEESRAKVAWKWSLAGTCLVLVLNAMFLMTNLSTSTSETEMIEELAVQYNSEWPSIYNNELLYENE